MTTDFCSGTVPPIYRQIFDVCSVNGEPVHRDIYQCLLSQCKLSSSQLSAIWDLSGPSHGVISRTNFYKSLALVAWAQQGKEISEKLFENCSEKEYPAPTLPDLTQVKNVKLQHSVKEKLGFGFHYADIVQFDTINIELVPEKKGLFLKYSEYVVTSKRLNARVTRRYNDFVALQELLLARFPYRLIPSLPPKKIVSNANFLESRRRALHRWLTLVCRHPTMFNDGLVHFFLSDQGPDIQHRIREIFRRAPDEFMTSDIAATAKDLLPPDSSQISSSREQIRMLVNVIGRIKQLTERNVDRQMEFARDTDDLSEQLRTLATLHVGQGPQSTVHWANMQKGFELIASDLQPLAPKSELQAEIEQIKVCERLGLLLDLLVAHRELCDRLERGLSHDHQVALSKMLSLKKRKIQGVIRGGDAESVEQLESKMLAQESVISNMELRSDFSFYCVHVETQLVHSYLETLSTIFESLVALKIKSHSELKNIWSQVQPSLQQFFNDKKVVTQNGAS